MRLPLLACSVITGIVGCLLFPVGGFMLFPVALDLWYEATDLPLQPALAPVESEQLR